MLPGWKTMTVLFILLSAHLVQAQDCIKLAEDFFMAVRNNRPGDATIALHQLALVSEEKLYADLQPENKAKAFWINLYNASVQYLLKADSTLFKDRDSFFKDERITVAATPLSLD